MQSHSRTEEEISARLVTQRLRGEMPSFEKVPLSNNDFTIVTPFWFREGMLTIDGQVEQWDGVRWVYSVRVVMADEHLAYNLTEVVDSGMQVVIVRHTVNLCALQIKTKEPATTSGTIYEFNT